MDNENSLLITKDTDTEPLNGGRKKKIIIHLAVKYRVDSSMSNENSSACDWPQNGSLHIRVVP